MAKQVNRYIQVFVMIVIAMILIPYFSYIDNKERNSVNKKALVDLNLHLTGVVENIDRVHNGYYHGCGIVELRVLYSNIKNYRPPKEQKFYFCVIRNDSAEIYVGASSISIGDTIKIDSRRKLMMHKTKNYFDEGSISVNMDEGYYDYISKHSFINKK